MKGDCGHTLDTSALRNVQLLTNKVGSVLKSFDTSEKFGRCRKLVITAVGSTAFRSNVKRKTPLTSTLRFTNTA